jgi:putative hydrolase of the HAD superfamily
MRYRAVLFDAGGTLFTVRYGRVERFQRALQAAGIEPDGALLAAAVEEADRATRWPGEGDQGTREEEDALWLAYCEQVWGRLGQVRDPRLRERLAAEVRWLRWIEVYPDTPRALARLRGRARLGVLSNNVPSLLEALECLGLRAYFDDVVVSALVGVSKPDPAIYRLALQRLGVQPAQALFVDDLEENVRAAQALGIAAVLLDREGQATVPLPTVRTLDELAGLALGAAPSLKGLR